MNVSFRQVLSVWEIAWGVYGLLALLNAAPTVIELHSVAGDLVLLLGGMLFVLSVVAGIFVLRQRPGARTLSMVVQGVQSLWLSPGLFTLQFVAGPFLAICWVPGNGLRAQAGMTSSFTVLLRDTVPYVGINLVATAVFLALVDRGDRLERATTLRLD